MILGNGFRIEEQLMENEFGDPVRLRNRKGGLARRGCTQEAQAVDLDLRAAMLAQRIRELADAAPPLSDDVRARLARLLVGAR